MILFCTVDQNLLLVFTINSLINKRVLKAGLEFIIFSFNYKYETIKNILQMSFNHFLLSTFTKDPATNLSSSSIQNRYRSLAIIYLCFLQISVCILFILCDNFWMPLPCQDAIIIFIPVLVIALIFLKRGKNNAAAATILIGYYTCPFLASISGDTTLGVLIGNNLMPCIGFLITSSSTLHTLNFTFSCLQILLSLIKINSVFEVVQTEEQEKQILAMQIVACCTFVTHTAHGYLTKYIEVQLLNQAEVNSTRVTDVTKELVKALSEKDVLVSHLSHEIRDHLNSLNKALNYLFTATKDITNIEALKDAKLSSEKLLSLISNTLDTIKLKSNESENEVDPVDSIRKVCNSNKDNLIKNQIPVKVFISNTVPNAMRVDASRLMQILAKVMSNAIKFTKNGEIRVYMRRYPIKTNVETLKQIEANPFGVDLQNKQTTKAKNLNTNNLSNRKSSKNDDVSEDLSGEFSSSEAESHKSKFEYLRERNIRTLGEVIQNPIQIPKNFVPWEITREDHLINFQENQGKNNLEVFSRASQQKKGYLKVQISDSGCGISKAILPKLVAMLSESSSVPIDQNGDTGFGLWISKHLCEKLGGDIAVYSEEGKGTTIVFYITINNLPAPEISQEYFNRPNQMCILVVDDDIFVRNLHKMILEQEGVQVTLASDGAEAVREYMQHQEGYFDLIMTDIDMAEMDGFTAAKKIREFEDDNEWNPIDIYFVSGEYYDEHEMFFKLKASIKPIEITGMKYLVKPIDIIALRKIIDDYSCKRERKKTQ